MFDLALPNFGPYTLDYSRNGRHLLIAGTKGHIATMVRSLLLPACSHVDEGLGKEKVGGGILRKGGREGCKVRTTLFSYALCAYRWNRYLHTEKLFAAAQKKYVYIYDDKGTEIHCLKKHIAVNRLEFLPYHFLLASVVSAP